MQIVVGLPSFSPNDAHCYDPLNPKQNSDKRKRIDESCFSNTHAMKRANAVASSLPQELPSFVKSMLPSHVTGGFWLGLPKWFCVRHLPNQDTTVTLEDETAQCYETKYLSQKGGLSGGWRGFSIAHGLVQGDALVFQLVDPTKFQVFIVRSNRFDEVDGALGLLKLDATSKKAPSTDINSNKIAALIGDDKYTDELICEVLDGIRFSQSVPDFKDVKTIEEFTVGVDGLVIDSEISQHVMVKYYQLCCSQQQYLHDGLVEGINCKLAAGIVSETVNIADAIRASKITTCADDFVTWGRTLKAFAGLGMEVGFLLARLEKLVKLDVEQRRRLKNARSKRFDAEREIVMLEDKVLKLRETVKSLDVEIALLQKNENMVELMLRETAKAPW